MGSPKRLLTAKKPDGTEFTGTYLEWAEINKCTKKAIQKRLSNRNQQIKRGEIPYTMEQVTGTVKLSRQFRHMKKRPIDEIRKSENDLRNRFLGCKLA